MLELGETLEDPEGEDPDGEDPDGEDPEGEDPEGEDPEGEDPEGEDSETEVDDLAAGSELAVLNVVRSHLQKRNSGSLNGAPVCHLRSSICFPCYIRTSNSTILRLSFSATPTRAKHLWPFALSKVVIVRVQRDLQPLELFSYPNASHSKKPQAVARHASSCYGIQPDKLILPVLREPITNRPRRPF